MRIAEVWMDDYKHLFHVAMGKRNLVNTKYTKSLVMYELNILSYILLVDFGNVTDRVALRHRLRCSSFESYLTNIFPERLVPLRYEAFGMARNEYEGRGRMCLHGDFDASRDNGVHAPLKVKSCVDKQKYQVRKCQSQTFHFLR